MEGTAQDDRGGPLGDAKMVPTVLRREPVCMGKKEKNGDGRERGVGEAYGA